MTLSKAERVALGLAAIVLLLQAMGVGADLELRRALLAEQPWRVLTGHLVHLSWAHVAINAAALVIVARLFAQDLDASRQAVVLLLSAIAIGLGLAYLFPAIAWYRGLSGVIHALFFAGATVWLATEPRFEWRRIWLPGALLFGGWIKVLTEQPHDGVLPHADWLAAAVVPQAHLIGAACGTVVGLAFALTDRRREQQRAEQQ